MADRETPDSVSFLVFLIYAVLIYRIIRPRRPKKECVWTRY